MFRDLLEMNFISTESTACLVSQKKRAYCDLLVYSKSDEVLFKVDTYMPSGKVQSTGFMSCEGYVIKKGTEFAVSVKYKDKSSAISVTDTRIKNDFCIEPYEFDNGVDIWDTPINAFSLTPYINGLKMGKQIMTNRAPISSPDEYSHQTMTVIKDGMVYSVFCANTQTKLEGDSNTFSRLAVFEIDKPQNARFYTIAAKGDNDGIVIDSIASLMSIADNGDTLECFCYGYVNGVTHEFHRKFDIKTESFGKLEVCKLVSDGEKYDFTGENLASLFGKDYGLAKIRGEMGMGSYELYNGEWYTWVYTGSCEFNGILLKTRDFVNFEFVMAGKERMGVSCEIMMHFFGDFMFVAYRRHYNTQRLVVVKYDMRTLLEVDRVVFKDCAMRPYFFEYRKRLYLIHATHVRQYTSIVELATNRLRASQCIASIENVFLSTPCPVVYNDELYVTYSAPNVNYMGVWISHFSPLPTISEKEVNEKILQLFE